MNNPPTKTRGSPQHPALAVSVVLPAYNAEKYIGAAMESILAQTFAEFELIVVDDGSIDRTLEIAYGYSDPRIVVIPNGKNFGLAKSLNKGILVARGHYIARQDADDISLPERLEKQYHYLEKNSQVVLLGTGRKVMLADGAIIKQRLKPPTPSFEDMLQSNCFVHGSTMIRRTALEAVGGYDEFFLASQDYELWLRLARKYPVANLPESLYAVRRNWDSISRRRQGKAALYGLLAVNYATGVVSDEILAQVKKDGIESYYAQLSDKDKISYHQRVAKRCMNYGRNDEAVKHYSRLMKLQGASFKSVGNILRLKFHLLGSRLWRGARLF